MCFCDKVRLGGCLSFLKELCSICVEVVDSGVNVGRVCFIICEGREERVEVSKEGSRARTRPTEIQVRRSTRELVTCNATNLTCQLVSNLGNAPMSCFSVQGNV